MPIMNLFKFDDKIYAHKLNANELGYRNGKPGGAGRFILVAKTCIGYFPPLSEVVLNDHVFIDLIPSFTDEVVLTNFEYHNSKYATLDEAEKRDEYRLYLNSKTDPNRDYYKPEDIVLFIKIYEKEEKSFIYKMLYLKPDSGNYTKVKVLIELTDTRWGSNALLNLNQLTFLDSLRKIDIGQKVIPMEIIEEAFKEPVNNVVVQDEKYDTTTILRSKSFRDLVLYFYDFKCAVTGKNLFIDHKDFNNLEAAHLLARVAGGGSNPSNGMALERNLHWAFDKGFFTVNFDGAEYCVEVHKDAMRIPYLASKNGQKLIIPEDSRSRPNAESLKWHKENVFGMFLKTEV
jgi:hypothetical protein